MILVSTVTGMLRIREASHNSAMLFLALLSCYWQLDFGAVTVLVHSHKQKAFLGKWHYTDLVYLVIDNVRIFWSVRCKNGGFERIDILYNENNFLFS